MGNLLAPLKGPDLVKGANVRGQTTVDTENPAVDHLKGGGKGEFIRDLLSHQKGAYSGKAQVVEHLAATLPGICIAVLLHAFVCRK